MIISDPSGQKRHPSAKAAMFTESVIREMTRLAFTSGAVNLAQGFPDFPAPGELKQAGCDAISRDINQYAITWGSQELRTAIAEKVSRFNGMVFDPETEITVTCGSTEAMCAAMIALVDPGDEVIVIEPFYENYGPDTIIAGAVPRFVALGPDWRLDPDDLSAAFSRKTRAIVLNTPNNPTGRVFTRGELEAVRDLCLDHDVLAFTDEIYEHIVYDGNKHVSIGSLDGMHDRTVTINSFSKTYSVTGWRVGYALASAGLTDPIRKVHDFLTVGAPAPLQHACVTALRLPDSYYRELARDYDERRRLLYSGLSNAGFVCTLPEGAYYILASIPGLRRDDTDIARALIRECGVAAVPGSSFYHDGSSMQLRFTFSKQLETLREACRRLESGIGSLYD